MKRIRISNVLYFNGIGFSADCFNYVAVLAEAFFAAKVLKATEFQMGLLGFFSALGYALSAVWMGALSDRIGRRVMMAIAATGMALCYLAAPHAPSMKVLYGIGFLRMVSTSFMWPALMAWMSETCPQERLAGVLGWYNITWACGILVGMWVSGFLFEHVGPASPFFFAAMYSAALLVWILVFTPRESALMAHDHGMEVAEARGFVREAFTVNFLTHFAVALVLYLFPKMPGMKMGETAQSLLHVIRMSGQVAAFVIFTHATVWHFRRWPTWLAMGLTCLGLVLVAWGRVYAVTSVGFFALGLGMGIGFMASVYYSMHLVQRKGLAGGIQESVLGAGSLVGPLFGGAVAKYSNVPVAMLTAIVPIVGGYLVGKRGRTRGQ